MKKIKIDENKLKRVLPKTYNESLKMKNSLEKEIRDFAKKSKNKIDKTQIKKIYKKVESNTKKIFNMGIKEGFKNKNAFISAIKKYKLSKFIDTKSTSNDEKTNELSIGKKILVCLILLFITIIINDMLFSATMLMMLISLIVIPNFDKKKIDRISQYICFSIIAPIIEESMKLYAETKFKAGYIFATLINIFEFTFYSGRMILSGGVKPLKAFFIRLLAAGSHYLTVFIQKLILKFMKDNKNKKIAMIAAIIPAIIVHSTWNTIGVTYQDEIADILSK